MKKNKKDPNDLNDLIIKDLANGVPLQKIRKERNVNINTIREIKKKFYTKIIKERNEKRMESKKNIDCEEIKMEEKRNEERTELTLGKDELLVGTCNDRHPMNVAKFIFETHDGMTKMFDYDWQDEHVKSFIKENISFSDKNIPCQKLVVIVTGLNCFNNTISKVCAELKVNLSFLHWCAESKSYKKQVIFDNFDMDKFYGVSKYISLFNKINGKLFIAGDPAQEVTDKFYIITVKKEIPVGDSIKIDYDEEATIYSDREDAWKKFISLVDSFYYTNDRVSIFIDICEVGENEENGKYIRKRKNLAKSYSYHKYIKKSSDNL